MTAAIQAAQRGCSVILFEKNPAVGKKLLATGSGRCNITNDGVAAQKYICADLTWMDTLLSHFGVDDLLSMLQQIGILVTKTSDGWYYPISDSAQTVVMAFSSALDRVGITLRPSSRVTAITLTGKKFLLTVVTENATTAETFEKVIVASGGKAYPALGSTGELFPILNRLGHKVIPKRPALAPVLVDLQELKILQGVRADVGTRLWNGKKLLAEAAGNLIFTEWGLNGPAVMDISQAVSTDPNVKLTLSLNFLQFFEADFFARLKEKRATDLPVKIFLGAYFPPKVTQLYLSLFHITDQLPLKQLDEGVLQQLIRRLSDTRLPVNGTRGFEFCQVSAGGVPVAEVDPVTLESRLIKGLHLVGETVDVVGPCGGYNLHYAFASGALAGMAVAKQPD